MRLTWPLAKLPPPNHAPITAGGKATLVSLIVKLDVVANMVPEVEPDLIDTVNVSAPSVVESAVGVTVNEPAFDVMVNEPELVEKSLGLVPNLH